MDKVVQEVVAMLRKQGLAGSATVAPAVLRSSTPAAKTASPKPTEKKTAAKVFITANMMERRLAESQSGQLSLAANEFLTPAAQDLVAKRHVVVKKLESPSLVTPLTEGSAPPGGFGVVVSGGGSRVEGLLRGLSYDRIALLDYSRGNCWIANTRALCQAIAGGQVRGGVLLLPQAADAMLLASKHRGVRPVQGSRLEDVATAIRHFDANLLVIEHAGGTFHEMRQMVRLFVGPREKRNTAKVLLNALAELEG